MSSSPASRKTQKNRRGWILLEDGSSFEGFCLGATATRFGEFVFHTGHTGYQEILTDPSYRQQFLVFSSPHIGTQGFHPEDAESSRAWASGAVLRAYVEAPQHWRKRESFSEFLLREKLPALVGVDTRALVLKLRAQGSLWGCLSTEEPNLLKLKKTFEKELQNQSSMQGLSLVGEVSTKKTDEWRSGSVPLLQGLASERSSPRRRCVVLDFGVKRQILRYLTDVGFEEVIVLPGHTKAQEILALAPDAVLLSNGPGDPAAETQIVEEIRALIGKLPLFGICLGHQLLALALGLKTYKLKFGHHAANHPVMNLLTGRVEITSQNHGFAVEETQHPDIEITHRHMNDGSVAGFRHRRLPIQGIQFHPESSPGPIDSVEAFEHFRCPEQVGRAK